MAYSGLGSRFLTSKCNSDNNGFIFSQDYEFAFTNLHTQGMKNHWAHFC